jgi:hypothetical protein
MEVFTNRITIEPLPKILVVDDNVFVRTSIVNAIHEVAKHRKKNILVEELSDGIDMIKSIILDQENNLPCVKGIFIDEKMEYINGSEATR